MSVWDVYLVSLSLEQFLLLTFHGTSTNMTEISQIHGVELIEISLRNSCGHNGGIETSLISWTFLLPLLGPVEESIWIFALGFGDGSTIQLVNQLLSVICAVFLGLVLAGFCQRLREFGVVSVACSIRHSPFHPLRGTLKQNVQLSKFQSCKIFVLEIRARAPGNIWGEKKRTQKLEQFQNTMELRERPKFIW